MQTKHTPGPWSITEDGATVLSAGKIPVAAVASVYPANARLIAAAPEMLKALEAVFRQTCTLGLKPDQNCKEMMAKVIAKALGEFK